MFAWLKRQPESAPFTLIHLTHPKAGSTWLYSILKSCFPGWMAPRGRNLVDHVGGDFSKIVFAPGRVYSAMFLHRGQFLAHPELADVKRFVLIRDLRDTLVSLYFSLKVSIRLPPGRPASGDRDILNRLNFEEGMRYLMSPSQLGNVAAFQRSWIGSGEIVLRYEDLIAETESFLVELFIDRLRLPLDERTLRKAIRENSFEARFGRKLGEEDIQSHGRQGAPGNWKKHLTPRLIAEFAESFGEILVTTGYERDNAWAS